jgi:hypothetical protein
MHTAVATPSNVPHLQQSAVGRHNCCGDSVLDENARRIKVPEAMRRHFPKLRREMPLVELPVSLRVL